MTLPLVAAALIGFVGQPTPQLITPARHFPPASVSSGTFRLPVARTPAVTAKVGGYASEPEDPIAPTPLVLDGTTKKQLAILVSTSFLVQLGVGMGIIVLPVFAQARARVRASVRARVRVRVRVRISLPKRVCAVDRPRPAGRRSAGGAAAGDQAPVQPAGRLPGRRRRPQVRVRVSAPSTSPNPYPCP